MKIAYLFIVYNKPEQVFNLIELLNTPTNAFFIHFKKGFEYEIPDNIRKLDNVFFAKKRYKAGWAGFNVILATLHLIELANNQTEKFDYYINLSGSCFPVKSNKYIEDYLSKQNLNFIEGIKLPSDKLEDFGLSKIDYPWFQDELQNFNPYFKKYFHKTIHFFYKLFKIKRKFPKGYDPYFGSQWWALTNEAIEILLKLVYSEKKVLNFFKRSWASDEQYIQTVIYNSKQLSKKIKNQAFRYIDWNTNGPPKTLTIEDYDKIKESGLPFARKFDIYESKDLISKLTTKTRN